MTTTTMTSRGAVIAMAMLGSACVLTLDPIGDDDVGDETTEEGESTTEEGESTTEEGESTTEEGESTTEEGESTTTDTTDTSTGETGDGDCDDPVFTDFFDLTITLDGEPIAANLDLDAACTVLQDNSPALVLDCGQYQLSIDAQGEASSEVHDPEGSTLAIRLITDDGWFSGETWLRIDYTGMSKSVFLIDALTLAPPAPTTWIPPWGLAVVDECAAIDDGCGEWVGQTLGMTWENQTLELRQGESGALGEGGDAGAGMWVERSWRYESIDPECDAPSSWQKLAIVSNNLVEGDTCIPGESDPCGTGLECCYPCGIPDCDFVCTAEDPDTMSCPPPPP